MCNKCLDFFGVFDKIKTENTMKKDWINGKRVLITGATSGLGRELTKKLISRNGCYVIAIGRNKQKFESLQKEIDNKKLECHIMDVSVESDWVLLANKIKSKGIDVIINCAGVLPPFESFENMQRDIAKNYLGYLQIEDQKQDGKREKLEVKDKITINKSQSCSINNLTDKHAIINELFEKSDIPNLDIKSKLGVIIDTNFMSCVYSAFYLVPIMEKTGTKAIINIASSAGLCPLPGISIYSASKSAVKNFTECLALEKDYYVGLVCPGFTLTDIFRYQREEVGGKLINLFATKKEKMANKIYRAIIRQKRRCVFGSDAKLMNILYSRFPKSAPKLFAKILKKSKLKLFEDIFN